MSFIYKNDKLLTDLIKSAVDHEMKFNKNGQLAADPSVNVEFRNYLTLTKKLSQKIKDKYFPPTAGAPVVSTGTGKDAALGVPELSSLGNFLDFIVNNQITVDGKRVAYGAGEQNPDPRTYLPVTAEQIKFMMETQTPEGDRAQFQADYYVSRQLLEKYITHMLRENSKQDEATQRFTKTMLGARIEDINRVFKTKLTTNYKEPEKQVDDKFPLDQTPKVLMAGDSRQGTEVITYGDLKTTESFNGWLISHKIGVLNEKNTLSENADQFMQNGSHCAALNILYYRAVAHLRASVRTEDSQRFQIAINQLQKLAPLYQCTLSGAAQPGQPGQQPGQGQGGGITPRGLVGLAALRPFNTERINFQELETFLDKYSQMKPSMGPLVGQVKNAMHLANGVLNSPGAPIQVGNMNAHDVGLWTSQPLQLLNYLYTVISVSGRIYTDFYTECQNVFRDMPNGSSLLRSVEEQIVDGGPQSVNLSAISRVMSTVQGGA